MKLTQHFTLLFCLDFSANVSPELFKSMIFNPFLVTCYIILFPQLCAAVGVKASNCC